MKAPARHPRRGLRRTLALRPIVDDPRRAPSPAITASLDYLARARLLLDSAADLLRGVATSVEAIRPDVAKDLTDEHVYAQVLAGLLDANVHQLRDLADPLRGVR